MFDNLTLPEKLIAISLSIAALSFKIYQHYSAINRAKKQQKINTLKELIALCEEIERASKLYWTMPESASQEAATTIICKLRTLSITLPHAMPILWPTVKNDFFSLKKACTGGDFQVTTRAAYPVRSNKLSDIEKSAGVLIKKLHISVNKIAPIK